jgi:hypothetical protein
MGEMSKLDWLIKWSVRDVGGFLVFLVCGVWFNLQDLSFFPTYFCGLHTHVGLILIYQTDLVSGYIFTP